MRILQIVPSLYNGGGETFAFQLSDTLSRRGHSVLLLSVCAPDSNSPLTTRLESAGFEFGSLGKKNGGGVDARIPWQLRKAGIGWRPDIVHTHLRALAYSSLLVNCGVPRFHTVHSLAQKECGPMVRRFYKMLFACGWQPVAISRTVGESIEQVYGRMPPGVDNGVQRPPSSSVDAVALRASLGIGSGDRMILHVGRLTETKNQLELLEIFASIASWEARAHLVLVGDDPTTLGLYRRRLEERKLNMSQEVGNRIHFLGTRGDIGTLLEAADVFALCSLYEGLPLALLEAMSFGLNCVCTKVGGIPDAIDENSGWLVNPGDRTGFEIALKHALNDIGGSRGALARRRWEQDFSMTRCAESYESLYTLALEGRGE